MSLPIIPVILSGGSGTRLWPLSQPLNPKQFLPLVSSRSLLQDTLTRLDGLGARAGAPLVICNEAHRFLVAEQLREISVAAGRIVLEPAGRNTAPALAVAALLALEAAETGAEPVLLVLPADHVIADTAKFLAAVDHGLAAAAAGKLVTFGIVPDKPETGYGYIRRGPQRDGWAEVAEFVEKPDAATAERYIAAGDYLWNSGMFLLPARLYLEELERNAPEMLPACRAALGSSLINEDFLRLGEAFLDCPADSIDYAVMEKTKHAAVVPLDAGWSDVGSWTALHEVLEQDADGSVLRGDVAAVACRDCYISANNRQVAVIGLHGVVVVETADAVLVMAKDRAQDLKAVVENLTAAKP
jgi:mannose-1-phosphate guanylyltransferase/mannose-6-phosphate isomerase